MASYRRIIPVKRVTSPPRCTKISGQVTLSGSGVSGAIVTLVNSNDDTLVGVKTTDGSGNYSFDSGFGIRSDHLYHAAVEYDDGGGNRYNDQSYPFLTPAENG